MPKNNKNLCIVCIVLKMNEKPQLQAIFEINCGSRVMCNDLNHSVKDIENGLFFGVIALHLVEWVLQG